MVWSFLQELEVLTIYRGPGVLSQYNHLLYKASKQSLRCECASKMDFHEMQHNHRSDIPTLGYIALVRNKSWVLTILKGY
jgi:hypothetical protein